MTLDPKEAAASLDDIDAIERRTRETLYYAGTSDVLILWGVLTLLGHLLTWFVPRYGAWVWPIIDVGGFLATIALVARRLPRSQWRGAGTRWVASYATLLAFGYILVVELSPLTWRQLEVFWPTVVMLGYVLAGIWIGRFFLYVGIAATGLILAGYFFLGDWFTLWLAFVMGGGFLAGGLWLRRSA
jgi:hypothetical protein